MRRKTIWMIGLTIITDISILLLLLLMAPPRPNSQNNGFKRKWLPKAIQPLGQRPTREPLQSICGATSSHIFFSIPNPQWLLMEDYSLTQQDTIFFPINLTKEILSNHKFTIDSPWVYLFANNLPGFIYGNMRDSVIYDLVLRSTTKVFTKAAYISPSTVVIRTFDTTYNKQIFQKINSENGQIIAAASIIDQHHDGGFATDGVLAYDSTNAGLVYLQFYENKFITLDTNLNVRDVWRTIDTTNNNDIKMTQAYIQGAERLIPSKARLTANKDGYVDNGLLYVLSGLKADNESLTSFNRNSVMDIYQIKDGHYIGSLYIPHIQDQTVRSVLIREKMLFVLHKDYIATYHLSI